MGKGEMLNILIGSYFCPRGSESIAIKTVQQKFVELEIATSLAAEIDQKMKSVLDQKFDHQCGRKLRKNSV